MHLLEPTETRDECYCHSLGHHLPWTLGETYCDFGGGPSWVPGLSLCPWQGAPGGGEWGLEGQAATPAPHRSQGSLWPAWGGAGVRLSCVSNSQTLNPQPPSMGLHLPSRGPMAMGFPPLLTENLLQSSSVTIRCQRWLEPAHWPSGSTEWLTWPFPVGLDCFFNGSVPCTGGGGHRGASVPRSPWSLGRCCPLPHQPRDSAGPGVSSTAATDTGVRRGDQGYPQG